MAYLSKRSRDTVSLGKAICLLLFRRDNLREWRNTYVAQIQSALEKSVSSMYLQELASLEAIKLATFVGYDQSIEDLATCVAEKKMALIVLKMMNASLIESTSSDVEILPSVSPVDLNRTLAIVRESFQPVIQALRTFLNSRSNTTNGLHSVESAIPVSTSMDFGRSVDEVGERNHAVVDGVPIEDVTTLAPVVRDQLVATFRKSGCLETAVQHLNDMDKPLKSAQELIRTWLAAEKEQLLQAVLPSNSSDTSAASERGILNGSSSLFPAKDISLQIDRVFDQLENVTALSLQEAFGAHWANVSRQGGNPLTADDGVFGMDFDAGSGSSDVDSLPVHASVVVLNLDALVFASAEYFALLKAIAQQLIGSLRDILGVMPLGPLWLQPIAMEQNLVKATFQGWRSSLMEELENRARYMTENSSLGSRQGSMLF